MAHASVRGRSHVADALPCQDAHRVAQLADGWLLLIASDGAGSAPLADRGAQLACDTLHDIVVSAAATGAALATLSEDRVSDWVGAVMDRLHAEAQELGVPAKSLACTLLMVLAGPSATHIIHLGDGALVAQRGEVLGVLSWPSGGEYANETFFLTDDAALRRVLVTCGLPAVDAVACFTDGLQLLLLQLAEYTPYTPAFDRYFAALVDAATSPSGTAARSDALAQHLSSDAVQRRADDDLTLLLARRRAS